MKSICVFTKADMAKGQGVQTAGQEQINLIQEILKDEFEIKVNPKLPGDINHYHTINPEFFAQNKLLGKIGVSVGYVHFLPETVEGSINLPDFARKVFNSYMITFYKSMDYHVVVNPYFIELMKNYNIDTSNTVYIPNFVSNDNFYPYSAEKRKAVLEKYGYSENDFIVLGVGQTQTRKGVLDFVEIAKQHPEMKFVWAGGFSFKNITEGYKEIKEVMENPPSNMNFIGIVPREEMLDLYNLGHVMFLPSYAELFPMTILEAMAVGKPILLRDLDIYYCILDGYYLKGNDNEEFGQLLIKLKEDPNFYQEAVKMANQGNRFYNKESVGEMWKNFYRNILAEHQQGKDV